LKFIFPFSKKLTQFQEILNDLVGKLSTLIPNFGKNSAFDGKAIASLSPVKKKTEEENIFPDKRREKDAEWGIKKYKGVDKEGNAWEKIKKWLGFRIHMIVDADHELPCS
jgi:hypothetical protein